MNPREEREAGRRHARNVETERGAVCGRSVARNRALRSDMVKVAEMRRFRGGESQEELYVVRLIRGGGQSY